ncbi:hypothetical protein CYLTODRAFT_423835 [Cylindrobasidium torrendii FP15055 ss-10]|uniref:RBR-type E3 ubiquitin transferase n=1 Tax=Cylindrobasidium torrendii FP15055 ss-10 TaxID=1314674 RepID=A0A0D7B707_9AGAR|nr:hypothetical protein CYLTODRAFT_423835 [Cylindrobasidium torrendii FP15055 ss-10]
MDFHFGSTPTPLSFPVADGVHDDPWMDRRFHGRAILDQARRYSVPYLPSPPFSPQDLSHTGNSSYMPPPPDLQPQSHFSTSRRRRHLQTDQGRTLAQAYPAHPSEPRPINSPVLPPSLPFEVSPPVVAGTDAAQSACCSVCFDDITGVPVCAPCTHSFDVECAEALVSNALKDESSYPPRCCGRTIPMQVFEGRIDTAIISSWQEKHKELSTPLRVYCAKQQCSRFLGPRKKQDDLPSESLQCSSCSTRTCNSCLNTVDGEDMAAHRCSENETEAQVRLMATSEKWATCPGCRSLVELSLGCNHVQCRCGTSFCYECSQVWHACKCAKASMRQLMTMLHRRQGTRAKRDHPYRRHSERRHSLPKTSTRSPAALDPLSGALDSLLSDTSSPQTPSVPAGPIYVPPPPYDSYLPPGSTRFTPPWQEFSEEFSPGTTPQQVYALSSDYEHGWTGPSDPAFFTPSPQPIQPAPVLMNTQNHFEDGPIFSPAPLSPSFHSNSSFQSLVPHTPSFDIDTRFHNSLSTVSPHMLVSDNSLHTHAQDFWATSWDGNIYEFQ